MRKRTPSLRWLIGGIYFFIMIIILGALAVYVSYSVEKQYVTTKFQIIEGQALLGADILSPLIYAQHDVLRATLLNIYKRTNARRVTLMEVPGTAVITDLPFSSRRQTTTTMRPEVRAVFHTGGTGMEQRFDPTLDEELLFIAVPVQIKSDVRIRMQKKWAASHPGAGIPAPYPVISNPRYTTTNGQPILEIWAVLVLAVPFDEIRDTVMLIRIAIGFSFVGVLLIVLLINFSVSNFISRPLATLSDAAVRFSRGNLNEHVVPSGAAEIASLGESFDLMAEQLRLTIIRLREERAQAEAILASMVDGVVVTDTDGRILMINRAAAPFCISGSETLTGQPFSKVIPSADLQELLTETLAMNLPLKHEMAFATPDEQIVEVHLAPVNIEDRPVGVVIVLYDVTHQRKLEAVQQDFVANVSHELRTPVASIRAMAETLLEVENAEPEMRKDFLSTIATESERLTALLDSLLKLAHIEHDRRMITPERVDLCDIIRDVVQRIIAPVVAKHQHITVQAPEHLYIVADRNAIVQVLINLLDNAQKYTLDGGAIIIRAEEHEAVRLQVCDNGIGIPPDEVDRIFERFYRVDRARSRAQGGAGLGLAIAKHLVEMHGGCILVESDVGVGSCFTVILPRLPAEESAPGEERALPTGLLSRSPGIPS